MSKIKKRIIVIFALSLLILPNFVQAVTVDYNNIVSDAEAVDYQSMDRSEIQTFLREQGSYLATYRYAGNNPSLQELAKNPNKKYHRERLAADIIYNAAQEWKINPQFILTMLEKEMSLISIDNPEKNRLLYAMGYNCPDSGGCAFKTSGFGKQVRAAAEQFRWFIDNIYEYKWQPGKPACADDPYPYLPCTSKGTIVTPTNKITAAMYLYTPHIHGNVLFAKLWEQFGFGKIVPLENNEEIFVLKGIFPEGALVKAKNSKDGTIYLITNETKRPFGSMSALVSRYDLGKILLVDADELDIYKNGAEIRHANYSVLENSKDQKYLIDGLQKRLITSDEAFRQLGFNIAEVEVVSDAELINYQTGEPLDITASPFKEVWQDINTENFYLIKDGQKAKIIDLKILEANYPDISIKQVKSSSLDSLPTSAPIKLLDGVLIKKGLDKKVYVVSNGYRRLIPDGETFDKLGYSWDNIITVSNKVINFHKVGPMISQ